MKNVISVDLTEDNLTSSIFLMLGYSLNGVDHELIEQWGTLIRNSDHSSSDPFDMLYMDSEKLGVGIVNEEIRVGLEVEDTIYIVDLPFSYDVPPNKFLSKPKPPTEAELKKSMVNLIDVHISARDKAMRAGRRVGEWIDINFWSKDYSSKSDMNEWISVFVNNN